MSSTIILDYAKRLKSIAHLGLTYTANEYDKVRYHELDQISLELMQAVTGLPGHALSFYFNERKEYITPKVDIRAVIFNGMRKFYWSKSKQMVNGPYPGAGLTLGNPRPKPR